MRLFMDQRENKPADSFRLSQDLSDMASSAPMSGSATGNRSNRSRRSRSANMLLNIRFKHRVCTMQITERCKFNLPKNGYYNEPIGQDDQRGSPRKDSGLGSSSFENSSEDMDELKRPGIIRLKCQKAVLAHSRYMIKCYAEMPN